MPATSAGQSPADALTRAQRLFSGVVLLLVVDLIWVASSEFTQYIFRDLSYDKPYFSTYFKTSLFSVYLLGFALHRPWREQCAQWSVNDAARLTGGGSGRYQRVSDSDEGVEDNHEQHQEEEEEDEEEEERVQVRHWAPEFSMNK